MAKLTLSDKADFGVMFDSEHARLGSERMKATGLTRELFISLFESEDYPSIGFNFRERPIGGLVLVEDDIHLTVLPAYHGRWAALWKPAMIWLFSLRSLVYANIEIDNEQCIQFAERNGWHRIGQVEQYMTQCVRYFMTADEMLGRYERQGLVRMNA